MDNENPFEYSPIINQAMQQAEAGDGLPAMPAISRELHKASPHDKDAIIFWMGVWRRGDTSTGWLSFDWHTKHDGSGAHPIMAPAEDVERVLAPLAHASRIRIMQAVSDGPRSSAEITEATGLKGGNLHYHLKELIHASYVAEKGGKFDLTGLGAQMLLTVTHIARGVSDRVDEGLAIGSSVVGEESR